MAVATKFTNEERLNSAIKLAVDRLGKLAELKGHGGITAPVLFTNPDGTTGQLWFELYRPLGKRTGSWAVAVRPDERSRSGAFVDTDSAPLAWRVLFAKDGVKALAEALELVAAGNDLRVDQAVDALNEWLRVADPEGV